ncbi:hypothetical protein MTR67_012027 [Solanum verrucosum]|uniref:Uncharacterized protein n=1 Tax=Solanum verrucosum TaxID=315347 RepID=A0AAF0Q7Y1_SOLVR|nr:hypothetical protein MTR67_012027 [Solanum verrucosum]
MRRLLPFSADLILSFKAHHTGTKGEICAAADHLASLVGIADQLGDSPFGVDHPCLAPAFSIVVLWAEHTRTKGGSKTLRRLAKWTR